MPVPPSTQRLFPVISKEAVTRASQKLGETNKLGSVVADKYLSDFQNRAQGVFYRSVDDMRAECSRLRYSARLGDSSASVISSGPAHQSVYAPNWLPAVGFLISGDAPVSAISRGLFLETPKAQSEADIQSIRETIVSNLKAGDTSTPHQATHFYAPRQSGVNEAHIQYGAGDIAGYALPLKPQDSLESLIDAETSLSKSTSASPPSTRQNAEKLRMVAQLAYAVSRLGSKPVFAFTEGQLSPINYSKSEWAELLSQLNTISENEYLLKVAKDPADFDRTIATGLSDSATQLVDLEKTIDPHAIKHVGGALTRVPMDIALAALDLFTAKKS